MGGVLLQVLQARALSELDQDPTEGHPDMTEPVTREERLTVQVIQLQKMLSDAEFARDRWRKSARSLFDVLNAIADDGGYDPDAFCLALFVDTYRWENTK